MKKLMLLIKSYFSGPRPASHYAAKADAINEEVKVIMSTATDYVNAASLQGKYDAGILLSEKAILSVERALAKLRNLGFVCSCKVIGDNKFKLWLKWTGDTEEGWLR